MLSTKHNFITSQAEAQIGNYVTKHINTTLPYGPEDFFPYIFEKINNICNAWLVKVREKIEIDSKRPTESAKVTSFIHNSKSSPKPKKPMRFPTTNLDSSKVGRQTASTRNAMDSPYSVDVEELAVDSEGADMIKSIFFSETQISVCFTNNRSGSFTFDNWFCPKTLILKGKIPAPELGVSLSWSPKNDLLYPKATTTSSQGTTTIESSDEDIIPFPTTQLQKQSSYFSETKTNVTTLNFPSEKVLALQEFVTQGCLPETIKSDNEALNDMHQIAHQLGMEGLKKYVQCHLLELDSIEIPSDEIPPVAYTNLLIIAAKNSLENATGKLQDAINALIITQEV